MSTTDFRSKATQAVAASDSMTERLLAQLESRVRQAPRESILIAFLVGSLLQNHTIRTVVVSVLRLALWIAAPIMLALAGWKLFQSVDRSQNGNREMLAHQSQHPHVG
jgi:hypothetical protein